MTNTVSRTVSDDTLNRIITIESSGNPNIKARTSSATGLGQFLNATWLAVVQKHAPAVMKGKTKAQILNMRYDPSFSIEMLARFTEDNQAAVGRNCTPGDLYLAHFLGVGDARAVYHAPPSAPVSRYVSNGAVKANKSILQGKTVQQVRDWAAKKMAKAGGHDWVSKYYKRGVQPVAFAAIDIDGENLSLPADADPELLLIQTQLKGMHYYSGLLDGRWGSKSAGALSSFINDRGGFMSAPTTKKQYDAVEAELTAALNKAEEEKFTRPVMQKREIEDPKTVAAIAPEVVPARQSLWTAVSGFLGTIVLAIWSTISDWAATIWNFFTANKDNIPTSVTDPTFLNSVFHKVPPPVWLFLAAAVFAFIGVNAWRSVRKINAAVSTGQR